jgi:thiol-disulfide isomerase/thioredoxin
MIFGRGSKSDARKTVLALAIASAFAVALTVNLAANGDKSAQFAHTSQTGKPATAPAKELSLIDLDGYRKLVADHHGNALLVTFWATWCEPCREEYPLVNQLAREYAPKGLDVVGVDMDDDAGLTLVRHFLDKNQPIFPNVRKKMGHENAFVNGVDPRWHDVMPANFFYAADGRLIGFMTGGQPRENFEKVILSVLAAPAGAASHP